MKPIEQAISICGNQSALAEKIGVTPQVVHNWLRRGNVPADYCPAIDRATAGVVRCEDLRPDLASDWAYLRATDCDKDCTKLVAGETAPEQKAVA